MSDDTINGNHTTLEGAPVLDEQAQSAPEAPMRGIIGIAVTLEGDREIFEIKIREPGIVRACGFWMKKPKVIASTVRGIEPVPMPMLMVECDPAGEFKVHRFAFVTTNRLLPVHPGYELVYRATAMRGDDVGHLFEIVEVPS